MAWGVRRELAPMCVRLSLTLRYLHLASWHSVCYRGMQRPCLAVRSPWCRPTCEECASILTFCTRMSIEDTYSRLSVNMTNSNHMLIPVISF